MQTIFINSQTDVYVEIQIELNKEMNFATIKVIDKTKAIRPEINEEAMEFLNTNCKKINEK